MADDEGLLSRVWSFRSQVEVWRGGFEAGVELSSQALAIAERLDLPEVACECLDVLGRRASVQSYERATEVFRRELEIAERGDLRLWKVRALLELGTLEMMASGDIGSLVQARDLAERDGAISALTLTLQNQCWSLLFTMRWDELAGANNRCVELCRRFGLSLLPHALIVTALIHALRGEVPEMEAALKEAEGATDDLNVRAAIWGTRGELAMLRENADEAREALDRAVDLLRQASGYTNWFFLGTRALLLELRDAGGTEIRAELRGITAPLASWNEAALDHAEAVALGRRGRKHQAEEALARGRDRLAWAPWLLHRYGRLAAEAAIRDGWGEPVTWLREAIPVLESAGHDRMVSACKALLRKAGAPVPRRGRGESEVPPELRSARVTSREVDVLRLVGDGLSNQEVAERLFLSPRTVETHVASMLRKTGLETRAQLVALAARLFANSGRLSP